MFTGSLYVRNYLLTANHTSSYAFKSQVNKMTQGDIRNVNRNVANIRTEKTQCYEYTRNYLLCPLELGYLYSMLYYINVIYNNFFH